MCKQQRPTSGFDVEGHFVCAVFVGGTAKHCHVRGDPDFQQTLKTLISLSLGCFFEDLAEKSYGTLQD